MAQEPEVIRQQMDETRSALTEKIETLENRVVETVQEATSAVSESVGTVKEAIQETAATVQQTVHESLSSVTRALDVQRQVARHPWTAMAGAAALGYIGGRLLNRAAPAVRGGPAAGSVPGRSVRWADDDVAGPAPAAVAPASSSTSPDQMESNWLSQVEGTFHDEIDQLKGLALGAIFGLARDMAVQAAPEPLHGQVAKLFDDVTVKLGGKPIQGPLLPESPSQPPITTDESQRDAIRSRWAARGTPFPERC